jgi:hypothetical protein
MLQCNIWRRPTLEDCWYGRVALLFSIRVKLDKKDGDGRSVRMDCDCAIIECLYDFAPGRCACARPFFGVHKVCIGYALCLHKVCNECGYQSIIASPMHRRVPSWWKEAGVSGTKQLYQPEKPVVYIVPITSILGRLPRRLIPAGGHGTIPAALRGSKWDLFPLGSAKSASGTLGAHFVLSKWYSNADLMQNNNIPNAHFMAVAVFMHTMYKIYAHCVQTM